MKSATSHKTAPQPAESESEATLRAKLAAVRKIGDERRRAKGIGALAPHLPEILLRDAFTAATEMAEESARAYAVRSLIAYLPKTLLREGLTVAKEMKDASYCYDILAGLVQRLPKMLLPEALDVALGIPEECWRNGAVEAIAEHAPKKWLHDALIKALLRKAPATNSPLENYGETSHKKLMLDRPDSGGAALEQSQFVQLARKIGFATAGRLLVGAASPDEQRALKTGMAACAREATSPEPPTSRVVMTPQQLAALTADTPLGWAQARYEKRLREVDLPNDKITNAEQARAAASLVTTYRNLVKQQTKLGLAPQPQDERILRAQRLSVAFYREQKAGHAPRRRGRPSKVAMNALA
jgi:hypothetical protein